MSDSNANLDENVNLTTEQRLSNDSITIHNPVRGALACVNRSDSSTVTG